MILKVDLKILVPIIRMKKEKKKFPSMMVCMRCIAYDFEGGFKDNSYNHKDEEGKDVPNIQEYYYE
jgi:hypothetical protein